MRNTISTKARVALMISFMNITAVLGAELVFWMSMPKGY